MARSRRTRRQPVRRQSSRRPVRRSRFPLWGWFVIGAALYVYVKTKGA